MATDTTLISSREKTFNLLSHAELATLCLQYLTQLFSNIEKLNVSWHACLGQVTWKHEIKSSKPSIVDFFGYAVTKWPEHYHLADTDHALDSKVMEILHTDKMVTKWYEFFHRGVPQRKPGHLTAQHIAGMLNLPRIFRASKDEQTTVMQVPIPYNLSSSTVRAGPDGPVDAGISDLLLTAARSDNAKTLDDLIGRVAELGTNLSTLNINAALNITAQRGCHAAVEALLRYSTATATDEYGRTPLHQAVIGGQPSIVKLLVEKDGIDINAQDHHKRSPLVIAAQAGLIHVTRMLVDCHPDLDLADENQWTALHYAVYDGNEMVSILVDHGADPTVLNETSQSPLVLACGLGYLDVVEKLVNAVGRNRYAQANIVLHQNMTPLEAATKSGHLNIVKLLLSQPDSSFIQATLDKSLVTAASLGHIDILKQLFNHDGFETSSATHQEALVRDLGRRVKDSSRGVTVKAL